MTKEPMEECDHIMGEKQNNNNKEEQADLEATT